MAFRGMLYCAAACCTLAFSVGCGGSESITRGKVTGRVTYQGAPLANVTVMFVPEKGPIAPAVTDDDGNYSINPGVAVGKAKAIIQSPVSGASNAAAPPPPDKLGDPNAMRDAMMAYQQQQKKGAAKPKSLVPEVYGDVKTTPLSFEIHEGTNEIPIEITK